MNREHVKRAEVSKIFNNSSFLLMARVIEIVFGLASIALVARHLGPESFGHFAFIMALITTVLFMTAFGLDQVIIKESAINKSKAGVFLGIALLNRVVFALMLTVIYSLIIFFFSFEIPNYLITAVYIVLFFETSHALANIYMSNFKSVERMGYDTILTAIGSFVSLLVVVAVVYLDLGFLYVIFAMGVGKFLRLLLCIYLSYTRFILPEFSSDLNEHWTLLRKSLAVGAALIFRFLSLKVDIFMLQMLRTSVDVGIFSISHRFLMVFQVLPHSIVQAIFPILSRLGEESFEKLASVYKSFFKILYMISLPMLVITFIYARDLITLIFGHKFLAAVPPLEILIMCIPLLFLLSLTSWTLFCVNKQRIVALNTGLSLLINIALDLVLIPQYGIIGAAIATLIAYFFLSVANIYCLYKILRALPSIITLFKTSICGVVMYMCMVFLYDWNQILIAFMGFSIYILLIYTLRCFNIKEIKALRELASDKTRFMKNRKDDDLDATY